MGRLDLRVDRVGQRGLVAHRHFAQEFPGRGNFVATFFDRHGAQPATASVDGADQLNVRVTQRLAINDHQLVLRGSQHLLLPEQQGPFQCGRVNLRQHALEGAFPRTTKARGAPFGPKT